MCACVGSYPSLTWGSSTDKAPGSVRSVCAPLSPLACAADDSGTTLASKLSLYDTDSVAIESEALSRACCARAGADARTVGGPVGSTAGRTDPAKESSTHTGTRTRLAQASSPAYASHVTSYTLAFIS